MNKTMTRILQILREFKIELIKILEDNIVDVILFGSFAKGDYTEESDIDVLIIVKRKLTIAEEDKISKICTEFLLRYGVLISAITYPENILRLKTSFIKIVEEESIRI